LQKGLEVREMHVSLKVAAGLALGTALAAPTMAATNSGPSLSPTLNVFEFMGGLNYESARNWDLSSSRTFGELFTAGVFGQNTLAATSLDGGPDTFSFGAGGQAGGLLTYGTPNTSSVYAASHVNPTTVIVAALTDDGSDWLAAGIDPLDGGGEMTKLRFDVGAFAAGLDPIAGFTALSAQMVLFSNGGAVYSTGSVIFDGGASGLTGSAIISGVQGQDIDEIQMIFTLAPTPGAASLLGLAGLAATRRRR
jgi:hypothetical protein